MKPDFQLEGVRWRLGDGPVLATAIHAGHRLHPAMADYLRLPETDRLREEDPFTEEWTAIGSHGAMVEWSRFNVDLNRSRERAVYAVRKKPGASSYTKAPYRITFVKRP